MFLSIDIGGTKTLLALFSSRGFLLKSLKFSTPSAPDSFLSSLKSNLLNFFPFDLKNLTSLKAVTIAFPGIIKPEQNFYTVSCENLGWKNLDLISPIKSLFSCPVFFANDADLATLHETSKVAKKFKKVIYLTFSTGIGGGISENGLLSPRSASFEPGHKKYLWNGRLEEWEDFASAKALSAHFSSPLNSLHITPKVSTEIISRLLPGLLEIISSESPNLIIIGGSLSYVLRALLPALKSSLASSLAPNASLPSFKKSTNPSLSVARGAFIFSKQRLKASSK
ncbi:ROK family protein [Candidatus Saccharibacteria bacterium]|nr:ROK family protein [Candidatus Saccharibacteria bacterium]